MTAKYEQNRKRNDYQLTWRVFESKDFIKVSKVTKARLNITIHPFLKEQFKIICDEKENTSVALEIENYIRAQVEKKLGKKLIFR